MRLALVAGYVVLAFGVTIACNEIVSRRRSRAPLNASDEFPCDCYTPGAFIPQERRCVVNQSNVTYSFTILVNVPESSLYAAAHTFVLTHDPVTDISDLTRLRQ